MVRTISSTAVSCSQLVDVVVFQTIDRPLFIVVVEPEELDELRLEVIERLALFASPSGGEAELDVADDTGEVVEHSCHTSILAPLSRGGCTAHPQEWAVPRAKALWREVTWGPHHSCAWCAALEVRYR